MTFCTVINCMDGRVQLPVIRYLQKRFDAEYVDAITEPGPNLILQERKNPVLIESILRRLTISLRHHQSVGVALVGHHDCAGNPAPKDDQIRHIREGIAFLRKKYEKTTIIGLWVDEHWDVHELEKET